MGQKVSGYLLFSLSRVCSVYVYMLFYRWKSDKPTDNKTVFRSAVIHRNVTAEVVVHIGGRAVGTVDFQLHAEHQRSMESRIAEIRGEKKKSGQYKTTTCSFPGEKSCHCTPLATSKGEGKFDHLETGLQEDEAVEDNNCYLSWDHKACISGEPGSTGYYFWKTEQMCLKCIIFVWDLSIRWENIL